MGRPKKYKTDAERDAANRESRRQSKARARAKRRKPVSWIKTIEQKLADVGEGPSEPDEPAPLPTGPGEPFADLPPLDLPGTSPSETTEDTPPGSEPGASAGPAESSGASSTASSKASKAEPFIDTKVLEDMASQMVEQGVAALAKYAAERDFIALGEPFPKLAGMCAAVIIRKHAIDLGMPEEDVAALFLFGIVGVNSIQAYRANRDEARKKEEAKLNVERSTSPARSPNGVPIPDEQRKLIEKQLAERAAQEQQRASTGSPVV